MTGESELLKAGNDSLEDKKEGNYIRNRKIIAVANLIMAPQL